MGLSGAVDASTSIPAVVKAKKYVMSLLSGGSVGSQTCSGPVCSSNNNNNSRNSVVTTKSMTTETTNVMSLF